ncbi:MAG: class I SAM-dependent methyltransferase [Opitutaceae bacterium]|nr:class I SAM-dependent methyltransferase [Opitutaceae bacterium]
MKESTVTGNDSVQSEGHESPFTWLVPVVYDLGAPALFSPLGGWDTLREQALDTFEVRAGEHVLELGCGTGGITEKLIKRGACVTAIDRSEPMLKRARRRAPSATIIRADIRSLQCERRFDRVLLAFVLHHLDAETRMHALRFARRVLAPEGTIGIVDWVKPTGDIRRRCLQIYLTLLEPPCAKDWTDEGFESHLRRAELTILKDRSFARGFVRLVVAGRDTVRADSAERTPGAASHLLAS